MLAKNYHVHKMKVEEMRMLNGCVDLLAKARSKTMICRTRWESPPWWQDAGIKVKMVSTCEEDKHKFPSIRLWVFFKKGKKKR